MPIYTYSKTAGHYKTLNKWPLESSTVTDHGDGTNPAAESNAQRAWSHITRRTMATTLIVTIVLLSLKLERTQRRWSWAGENLMVDRSIVLSGQGQGRQTLRTL